MIAAFFSALIRWFLNGWKTVGLSRHNPSARRQQSPLERVLLKWTPHDPFRVIDLLDGGVLICGRSGSGKTSSSGRFLGQQIVNDPRSGGLILAAKPTEDERLWRKIFAKAERQDDLLVFGPESDLRLNFLNYARQLDGQTRNIVHCLQTLGEQLQRQETNGSSDRDPFWKIQEERILSHAIEVVKLATGTVTAPDLQRFITTAATSPEQLSNPDWRSGFHAQLLEQAHQNAKTEVEVFDLQQGSDMWLGEYPVMADKTRSSILAGVLGTLHTFNSGIVRTLVSGTTNITPDAMFQGKWILVCMPPAVFSQAGLFVNAGWKYLTQRAVLKRSVTDDDFYNVIWADEAQQFISSSFDPHYIASCRSHRGCLVYLTQSLPGLYTAFGSHSAEHQAHALAANFAHTILHAVDPVTAEWAAKKLGRRKEYFFSGSQSPSGDMFDALFGGSKDFSASFSEHYENVLQENVFQNGLRTGGRDNGYECDAILIRSGEPFSTGENYLRLTFSQG